MANLFLPRLNNLQYNNLLRSVIHHLAATSGSLQLCSKSLQSIVFIVTIYNNVSV